MITTIDIRKGANELLVTLRHRPQGQTRVQLFARGNLLLEQFPKQTEAHEVQTLRLNLPYRQGRLILNVENAELVAVNQSRAKRGKLPPKIKSFVDAAIFIAYAPGEKQGRFELNGYRFAAYESLGLVGLANPTPARIVKATNEIEIDIEEFTRLEVQERILVLLHEFAHGYLNREYDNETEADYNALRLYAFAFMPIHKMQIVEAIAEEILPQQRVRDAVKIIEQIEL